MTFILLHCSTKMLPKQQEGPVCVMTALGKPLIVCIWVELELVIGKCTHCLISEHLPRNLFIPEERGSFFPPRYMCDHLLKVSSGALLQDGSDHTQGWPSHKVSY